MLRMPYPGTTDLEARPCADACALHDLAALSEGNLSPAGRRRLAGHLAHCRACQRLFAYIHVISF
jgi:anti-sigma factor RsiW